MKRVFNQDKTQELQSYDEELGRVEPDKLFVAHHEATVEVQEVSHMKVLREYPNGGKDVEKVIDVPYSPAMDAWDEYEDIYVFVPYTAEELALIREKKYKAAIVTKIRERYTLDDELALARQRDAKPDEWAEYNAYCEACKAAVKAVMEQ